jgi:drug/metabolite transporter (DMT)-like permease
LKDFAFDRRQILLLVVLTIVWGLNWPVMKLGVTGYPPLAFRALSMWFGLPVLALRGASRSRSRERTGASWSCCRSPT